MTGCAVLLAGTASIALAQTGAPATVSAAGSGPGRATIGRTYPIAEPDALSEIEAKVATLPKDMSANYGPRSKWSALKAAALPSASADRTRTVVPFYTLDFDLKLPDGRVLYPKGFTFNPLTYVKLPQRIVVVHPRDLAWALRTARQSDFILLAALGADNGDAIEASEKTGRAIYILEERVKERLGIQAAPVIVAQSGTSLVLTEYGPKSRAAVPGGPR
ncbi:conjugal transfer protein TraW [Sphingomonas abietis]|uniref:Conjugal transfer protein TraW n=1 Tax=Sphingomonas abietis TaxID=3012344 RepID=A0ABY7NK82_9SPHN|nr:conjugal transfer protein TraW [Sphingomonas abietis]WBO21753.1 conjugal transfer protein TraW [Sphingomonas abietis]